MLVTSLAIPDVKLIKPRRHGDARGYFSEVYNAKVFAEAGVTLTFVQDNHAYSQDVGTLRGLHFQTEPYAQTKLVRVARGRIFDVAVDLRRGSPTFGQHVSAELSAENGAQLLVPAGFAHGYYTMEPNTEVLYKVDAYYAPAHDRGILWSDPDLRIPWPIGNAVPHLSAKDTALPRLKDLALLS
jgi:dTDP-4-dehydrorhamnose 3,5-epimerase